MNQKIKREDLVKEMADLKNLISHLEDEYRKANISEKYYQELKENYSKKLEELEKKLGIKKEEKEEKVEEVGEEKPKIGILGRLMGKKEQGKKPTQVEKKESKEEIEVGEIEEMTPEVIEKLAQQVAESSGVETKTEKEEIVETAEKVETAPSIEIEKLKVIIDSIRNSMHNTDETIRTISESIGEIRSMVFQTDGSLRETALKLEKIEDDVSELRPKEIEKKFREINSTLEKQQMFIEKFERKSEDLAEKINKVYEMMKKIGGIENLANLNTEIKKKIEDMKEALKYTERIAFKTEKTYIDLSKSLEDFVVYKTKQESLEETVKDLIKSVDGVNLKLETFPTKRDIEMLKGDILVIKKQIEEINKVLPVVQIKLPETIESLRKEKEDILLFLDSLEEQLKAGKISIGEYEEMKKKNLSKLARIESNLKKEWERISDLIEKGEIPKERSETKKVEEEVKETKDVEREIDRKKMKSKNEEERKEETKNEEMVDVLRKIREKIK